MPPFWGQLGDTDDSSVFFNDLEGRAAPHNSFVSIRWVDSNPISPANIYFVAITGLALGVSLLETGLVHMCFCHR